MTERLWEELPGLFVQWGMVGAALLALLHVTLALLAHLGPELQARLERLEARWEARHQAELEQQRQRRLLLEREAQELEELQELNVLLDRLTEERGQEGMRREVRRRLQEGEPLPYFRRVK